ncbi:class II aldolase/adducin family protein [Rhizobium laguerreae]|uniref:class II aldolase/adducin family protein n=1 Tax=Rhizobium laguerreae TaxID=1076926 RepID=UPI001C9157F8|nr:class II aldolase/adducin family protein [Rhizobium laguerreae]
MNMASTSVPTNPMSEADLRVQLAACYRLVAHFGMDDLIYNHISVRLPGPDHHFLINPYGLLFSEINASCFVKIDLDGNKIGTSDHQVNRAGFVIHSAIHSGREDAICVLHTHSEAATAISALEGGLLPVSQFAMRYMGHMGLHDYEGVAIDTDERQRLIDDIGPHNVLVLRNHGVLTVGRTIPEAFILMYYFEKAARVQLMAQSAGARIALPKPEVSDKAARQFNDHHGDILAPGSREWPAFIRLLDRLDPSYRD